MMEALPSLFTEFDAVAKDLPQSVNTMTFLNTKEGEYYNNGKVMYMNEGIICYLVTCDKKPLTGCRMGEKADKVEKSQMVITFTTVTYINKENFCYKVN
jgi:hypothetical protein